MAASSAVTWEEMAKMFSYLHTMWDDSPQPEQLFGHLSQACGEVAHERATKIEC